MTISKVRVSTLPTTPVDAIAPDGVLEQNVNFLQKPFTMTKLGEKVRRILDSR